MSITIAGSHALNSQRQKITTVRDISTEQVADIYGNLWMNI